MSTHILPDEEFSHNLITVKHGLVAIRYFISIQDRDATAFCHLLADMLHNLPGLHHDTESGKVSYGRWVVYVISHLRKPWASACIRIFESFLTFDGTTLPTVDNLDSDEAFCSIIDQEVNFSSSNLAPIEVRTSFLFILERVFVYIRAYCCNDRYSHLWIQQITTEDSRVMDDGQPPNPSLDEETIQFLKQIMIPAITLPDLLLHWNRAAEAEFWDKVQALTVALSQNNGRIWNYIFFNH